MVQFGRNRRKAQAGYRQSVEEGLQSRPWDELKGQIYLGSQHLIAEHAGEAKPDPEIPERN